MVVFVALRKLLWVNSSVGFGVSVDKQEVSILTDPRGTVVLADFRDPSAYDNAGDGALLCSTLVKSKLSGSY